MGEVAKKESEDDEEKKGLSSPMGNLHWWCPNEFEEEKGNNQNKQRQKNEKNQKDEKSTKVTETSKGGDEQQTKLRSAWTLLREFFRRPPGRLWRESEGCSFIGTS
jgi:hypothetical protein